MRGANFQSLELPIIRGNYIAPPALIREECRRFNMEDRNVASTQKNVLVTGASSGIGRSIAVRLANAGWQVFAGVRSEKSAAELRTLHEAIRPLTLDITDSGQISAAKKIIGEAAGANGLQALVNNAGIAVAAPQEHQPVELVRRIFETNVIGHMAVTQAFLPLIRAGNGRIVFIGSGAGFIALPFFTAYAASKFAIEGVTDSLRRELRPWHIPVINVEPGTIKTPILDKGFREAEGIFSGLPAEARERYDASFQILRQVLDHELQAAPLPESVAVAVQIALDARRPKHRYPVGTEAWLARTLRLLPTRLVDVMIATWHSSIAKK